MISRGLLASSVTIAAVEAMRIEEPQTAAAFAEEL
jgi:hypothetical protein